MYALTDGWNVDVILSIWACRKTSSFCMANIWLLWVGITAMILLMVVNDCACVSNVLLIVILSASYITSFASIADILIVFELILNVLTEI